MEEIWKDVVGYEGIYDISNLGRIRKRSYTILNKLTGKPRHIKGGIRKAAVGSNGYRVIRVSAVGFPAKTITIHRTVAEAFIENPENKKVVHHIDNNKLNNKVTNLKWVSYKQNSEYATSDGARDGVMGTKNKMAKLNELQVRIIKKSPDLPLQYLAEAFSISKSTIKNIRYKVSWVRV